MFYVCRHRTLTSLTCVNNIRGYQCDLVTILNKRLNNLLESAVAKLHVLCELFVTDQRLAPITLRHLFCSVRSPSRLFLS